MAQGATPDNLYPLATAAGVAIPLAVARPKLHIPFIGQVAEVVINLPLDSNICECIFEQDAYIYEGTWSTPVSGVPMDTVHLCKAGLAYDLALPSSFKVRPRAGALDGHINVVETWVQLQNTNYGAS